MYILGWYCLMHRHDRIQHTDAKRGLLHDTRLLHEIDLSVILKYYISLHGELLWYFFVDRWRHRTTTLISNNNNMRTRIISCINHWRANNNPIAGRRTNLNPIYNMLSASNSRARARESFTGPLIFSPLLCRHNYCRCSGDIGDRRFVN